MVASAIRLYKNAYSGLSRSTWYLGIVMLINRSGTMVIPFMTIYCTQQLHFTVAHAGIILSLFGAGAIVGAYIGGRITDSIGFYPQQVGSLFLGGLMFIVTGYLRTFPLLCCGIFVLSICNESFRPANSAAIAHYSVPANRTRSYSLNRLAINLGWAAGGAVGGFLASVNYDLLFWVDGCTNILAALFLLRLLPPVKTGLYKKKIRQQPIQQRPAFRDKTYLFFIALTILFASCFFQLFTMQPLFYKTQWHFNERFIGILMALNGFIIVIIEMIIVYSLEGRRSLTVFIRTGVFLVGVGYILVNILPAAAWVAVISVTVITIGEILSMPFMNSFWVARTNENNRGQYAAMYTMAWSSAQILAPAFGSQVIEHKGFNALWWDLFVICIIASAGFMLLGKYSKKQG